MDGKAEMTQRDDLAALQAENARLAALLDAHGIAWRLPPARVVPRTAESSRLTTAGKIALFRKLFRGRSDVYPVRWEGRASGKSGYAPACANEWRAGICEKPRVKCADCTRRVLLPLTDTVIYKHLAGEHTVGVYPLLEGEGFDHPPLDTLVLAMPVSWKGRLQQYAGRLHREHTGKTGVRIIDFVDTGHPALLRMWDKRQRGYRAMGYRVEAGRGIGEMTRSVT